MKLKELLLACEFKDTIPHIIEYDPKQEGMISDYKNIYEILCHTEAVDSDEFIEISWHEADYPGSEPYIYVGNCEGNFWNKNLGKEVIVRDNLNLTNEQIVAYCLWSLTFYGFYEIERRERWSRNSGRVRNKYEVAAERLRMRLSGNYHHKEFRGKDAYPKEECDYWWKRKNRRNRSKRMRDHRMGKRIKQLERLSRIEKLIQRFNNTNLSSHIIDSFFSDELIFEYSYHSYAYDVKQRIPYIIDLLEKYEVHDFNQYNQFIFLLETDVQYPLTKEEEIFIAELIKVFPMNATIHWTYKTRTISDPQFEYLNLGVETELLVVGTRLKSK
ncbi:hypothetical protein LJC44_00065 [Parabacteroides sp. OttesenSCG-928-G06]|nr:hypothetical protein [Parabacteroides sp. OttesenSCG-928-G06]